MGGYDYAETPLLIWFPPIFEEVADGKPPFIGLLAVKGLLSLNKGKALSGVICA